MSNDRFSASLIPVQDLPSIINTKVFENLLLLGAECNASDVIFRSGTTVRARVSGALQSISSSSIDFEDIYNFVKEAETEQTAIAVLAGQPRSFAYRVNVGKSTQRYRMSVSAVNERRTERGLRLVCRPIDEQPPRLQDLKLPVDLFNALNTPNNKGIILVTGETGSGKSTLLASTLDEKARGPGINIASLEDPIEFNLAYLNDVTDSIVAQQGLHSHLRSFADGLRGLLRDNPDVINVGEMRDAETIKLSVEASKTGHLVYSTLHVSKVSEIVERICVQFSEAEQKTLATTLINSLRCGVNQELVQRICQSCAEPVNQISSLFDGATINLTSAKKPVGCEKCGGKGFRGRYPLIEYLVLTNHARTSLLKELNVNGLGGISLLMEELITKFGQTKLKATQDAFEKGMITEQTFQAIYVEYQSMEFLKEHG